jgi:hypothetical protein
MSIATGFPAQVIVQVRRSPGLPWQAFEQWLLGGEMARDIGL